MADTNEPEPEPEPVPVEEAPAPEPAPKKKRVVVKMTDKQKLDLKKHMDKVGKKMSVSERKSHRMKMMSRMRSGDSVAKAHKAVSA
jgi:hypothetical protein